MAAACVYFPGSRAGSQMFRSAGVIMFVKRLERAKVPRNALHEKHSFVFQYVTLDYSIASWSCNVNMNDSIITANS